MWLSSRNSTICLRKFVARHPGQNLEPLLPISSNDGEDAYERLDANLVRNTSHAGALVNGDAASGSNSTASHETEPEDLGQLAKAVWNKIW